MAAMADFVRPEELEKKIAALVIHHMVAERFWKVGNDVIIGVLIETISTILLDPQIMNVQTAVQTALDFVKSREHADFDLGGVLLGAVWEQVCEVGCAVLASHAASAVPAAENKSVRWGPEEVWGPEKVCC